MNLNFSGSTFVVGTVCKMLKCSGVYGIIASVATSASWYALKEQINVGKLIIELHRLFGGPGEILFMPLVQGFYAGHGFRRLEETMTIERNGEH